jgi:hypothetical protein
VHLYLVLSPALLPSAQAFISPQLLLTQHPLSTRLATSLLLSHGILLTAFRAGTVTMPIGPDEKTKVQRV